MFAITTRKSGGAIQSEIYTPHFQNNAFKTKWPLIYFNSDSVACGIGLVYLTSFGGVPMHRYVFRR